MSRSYFENISWDNVDYSECDSDNRFCLRHNSWCSNPNDACSCDQMQTKKSGHFALLCRTVLFRLDKYISTRSNIHPHEKCNVPHWRNEPLKTQHFWRSVQSTCYKQLLCDRLVNQLFHLLSNQNMKIYPKWMKTSILYKLEIITAQRIVWILTLSSFWWR